MHFEDRTDAGRRLAAALQHYRNEDAVVMALPRGGLPVVAEIAADLHAPLDIVLVRKIGAPMQPELALGAVVDGGNPIVIRNAELIEGTGTSEEEFNAILKTQIGEIERRRAAFGGTREAVNPEGRVVIVVDDGIATGATMRAALQALRTRNPKKLVMAVPVAPPESLRDFQDLADEVICLGDLGPFGAIGFSYQDFTQLTDDDVVRTLSRFSAPARGGG